MRWVFVSYSLSSTSGPGRSHGWGRHNGDVLEAFVEQVLISELSRGDGVVLDKPSSRKRERGRKSIESAGGQLMFL